MTQIQPDNTLVLSRGHRARLSDQLYGQIFDQLVSGRWKLGDKLPPEKEICELFGVSRPIVREALLRLRADGLVTAKQGSGTFVAKQPASQLHKFSAPENVAEYMRCQEVRLALEGDAARLAAHRRTAEQITKIRIAHESYAQALRQQSGNASDGLDFHTCIIEASGNSLYLSILEGIHESLLGFMRMSSGLNRSNNKALVERNIAEHASILAAIIERDGERARVAMQYHLDQARSRLLEGNHIAPK